MKVTLEFQVDESQFAVDEPTAPYTKLELVKDLIKGDADWPNDVVINADIDGTKHQITL